MNILLLGVEVGGLGLRGERRVGMGRKSCWWRMGGVVGVGNYFLSLSLFKLLAFM